MEHECRELRNRLSRTANAEDAYVTTISAILKDPENIDELIARITPAANELPISEHVIFTGDQSIALEVQVRDQFGRYAGAFWDYLHVLHDFALARLEKGFEGNVHQYLTSESSDGHKCPVTRRAGRESESVLNNRAWRLERVFPVPSSVVTDGEASMQAHFKPSHHDTFAPRLYYYNDLANTKKIYVGYVGRHLTNTKT